MTGFSRTGISYERDIIRKLERWLYGVFQSLSTWISSLLVSTQLPSNGDDAIVVCIQRVYANSKWVGCTCSRGLPDRSGPVVLLMPASKRLESDSTLL